MGKFVEFMSDESGASAAEYALILALIAAAIIASISVLGNSIAGAFNKVAGNITNT
jgi:pilus assembly protein Flp/PilA